MGAASRTKGSRGELDLAAALFDELGVRLHRRLRQYQAGGHDLEVDPEARGPVADRLRRCAIEIKRHVTATPALIDRWWRQTVAQAEEGGRVPVLAYRADRQPWRIRVPLAELCADMPAHDGGTTFTAELSLEGFAALMREGA